MEWRKAWEKNWESIRYCSASCRRVKLDKRGAKLREEILGKVSQLRPHEFIAEENIPHDNREEVRSVARLLYIEGLIGLTQSGKPIKDTNFKGPIEFRKCRS